MQPPLARPFALFGLAGAWLTAEWFQLGTAFDEISLRSLLLVTTPVAAWVVGKLVGPERSGAAIRLPLAAIAGGVFNGAVFGVVAAGAPGVMVGCVMGGLFGALFVPFLALPYLAYARDGARRKSIVARVERRSVWAATTLAIGIAAATVARQDSIEPWIGLACAALMTTFALADAWAYVAVRAITRRALTERSNREAATTIDLGLGDETWEDGDGATGTYRHAGTVERAYIGAPVRARQAVAGRAVMSALAALATMAVFVAARG